MKNRFYTREVKLKAVEMKLAGIPVKGIMKLLNVKSELQVYIWYYWHRDGELYRFNQSVNNIFMGMALMRFKIQVIKIE